MDAFLYQNGKMIDLTELIESLGLKIDQNLVDVVGIDDAGQIAFNASVNGQTQAFLLNTEAVPEPSTMLILGLGAAALFAKRRGRKTQSRWQLQNTIRSVRRNIRNVGPVITGPTTVAATPPYGFVLLR